MFAHCNGYFSDGGVFQPREIFVAPVEEEPSWVEGFTIRPRTERMTSRDQMASAYAADKLNGMPLRRIPGDVELSEAPALLEALVGYEVLYVKGPSQLALFHRLLPDSSVVDAQPGRVWDDPDVLRRRVDFALVDMDWAHLRRGHSPDHRKNCAAIKCAAYAHHLARCFRG